MSFNQQNSNERADLKNIQNKCHCLKPTEFKHSKHSNECQNLFKTKETKIVLTKTQNKHKANQYLPCSHPGLVPFFSMGNYANHDNQVCYSSCTSS